MRGLLVVLVIMAVFSVTAETNRVPLKVSVAVENVRNIRMTNNILRIRMENVSDAPVKIMKPLDGSFWLWHLPFYRLTVKPPGGEALPNQERLPMSGLWAETKFPDDYEVTLSAGERYEMEKFMPVVVPTTGVYQLHFEYIFDPALSWRDPWKYPDDMWIGRCGSETVSAHLVETR